jgi:hypothetical protein
VWITLEGVLVYYKVGPWARLAGVE